MSSSFAYVATIYWIRYRYIPYAGKTDIDSFWSTTSPKFLMGAIIIPSRVIAKNKLNKIGYGIVVPGVIRWSMSLVFDRANRGSTTVFFLSWFISVFLGSGWQTEYYGLCYDNASLVWVRETLSEPYREVNALSLAFAPPLLGKYESWNFSYKIPFVHMTNSLSVLFQKYFESYSIFYRSIWQP